MKKKPLKDFLADRFSLRYDSAHDEEIIDSICRNVEFKGSNLWALIFAIFIASIGLNVNSTAVIIGAMLVSPLMGPIMGFGLGIGINDIELVRKALKNLLIAVFISIGVSAFYFLVTPLHEAQSELLARTTPSIWDVFIALFGGLAGIVGSTRKEKSNVIPGVAIATALMPPLCTAGFGMAIGNWYFFLGAIYLFFINSVFICISTYLIVRYMRLPKKAFEDKAREKRVQRLILFFVLITALPSIYLAYNIVEKSIFETNAASFVKNEFKFPESHVVSKTFKYENGSKEIDVLLIGQSLPDSTIGRLKTQLSKYKIAGARLSVLQGATAGRQIDFAQIKSSILDDVFARQAYLLQAATDSLKNTKQRKFPDLTSELKILFPTLSSYSFTHTVIHRVDTNTVDTIAVFSGRFSRPLPKTERIKLSNWLKKRVNAGTVSLIIESDRKK